MRSVNMKGINAVSPGPMTTAHRGGDAYLYRVGQPANPARVPRALDAPLGPPPAALAHQGRGAAALGLADRIIRQAQPVQREDVTPEMEPFSPAITDEEPGEDFTDNEDVTPDMEPYDATIESTLKATAEGDETSVTITAEEGETITAVTEEDEGDISVEVEDTADVLLSP
jgi:hypothetical protein